MHPRDAPAALAPGRLAPLTAAAAALLWAHQNPDDCAAAQYLVSHGHVKGNGIGSIMHVTGYHFAVAVEEGRVFLFGPKSGEEWTASARRGLRQLRRRRRAVPVLTPCCARPHPAGRDDLRQGAQLGVPLSRAQPLRPRAPARKPRQLGRVSVRV